SDVRCRCQMDRFVGPAVFRPLENVGDATKELRCQSVREQVTYPVASVDTQIMHGHSLHDRLQLVSKDNTNITGSHPISYIIAVVFTLCSISASFRGEQLPVHCNSISTDPYSYSSLPFNSLLI